jgi:hypothetical protein
MDARSEIEKTIAERIEIINKRINMVEFLVKLKESNVEYKEILEGVMSEFCVRGMLKQGTDSQTSFEHIYNMGVLTGLSFFAYPESRLTGLRALRDKENSYGRFGEKC